MKDMMLHDVFDIDPYISNPQKESVGPVYIENVVDYLLCAGEINDRERKRLLSLNAEDTQAEWLYWDSYNGTTNLSSAEHQAWKKVHTDLYDYITKLLDKYGLNLLIFKKLL